MIFGQQSRLVPQSETTAAFLYTAAFSVTEMVSKPACGQHQFRSHDSRTVSSTDLNNLRATWFGNRLAQRNIAVSAEVTTVALDMQEALCWEFWFSHGSGMRATERCVTARDLP